jgi:hypothetical protein
MNKYTVVQVENDKFDICETNTNSTLKLLYSSKRIKPVVENLNRGSGFCGWTPSFFTTNMKGYRK